MKLKMIAIAVVTLAVLENRYIGTPSHNTIGNTVVAVFIAALVVGLSIRVLRTRD